MLEDPQKKIGKIMHNNFRKIVSKKIHEETTKKNLENLFFKKLQKFLVEF